MKNLMQRLEHYINSDIIAMVGVYMRSKAILINNYSDYNKFLKKLNIYKSILYYNTIFVVKNNINDNMIDYIVNALNIKNRKKRITYIYDSSCKLIDDNTKNSNICGFKNGKCYVQRNLNNEKCNGCVESVYIKQIKGVLLKTFHVNYLIVLKLHQDIIL